jgi:hypothetical protein
MQYIVSKEFYDIASMLIATSLNDESDLEFELATRFVEDLVLM